MHLVVSVLVTQKYLLMVLLMLLGNLLNANLCFLSNLLQVAILFEHAYQYLTIHMSHISIQYKTELNRYKSQVCVYFGHESHFESGFINPDSL